MAVIGTDSPADHYGYGSHAGSTAPIERGGSHESRAARRHSQSPGRWPLAGVAAGVFGALASVVFVWDPTPEVTEAGTAAIAAEATDNHWTIFAGASAGFVAIIALLVFAAGYTKLVERRAPDSLAVPATKLAFAATLGTLIFGFGLKHVLAGGAGGVDADFYTDSQVEVVGLIVSQMQYASWWGVMLIAGCTAVLALRAGVLPRWLGVLSAVLATISIGVTLALGLPYSAGLLAPIWLVAASIAVLRLRDREV